MQLTDEPKRRFIVASLTIVALALVGAATWLRPSPAPVRDDTPVVVNLGNPDRHSLRLKIPKPYLVRESQWAGGDQTLVNIQARLPDMRAESAAPESGEQRTAFANGVAISLFASSADSAEARKEWSDDRVRERMGFHSHVYDRVAQEDVPGLERYREMICSPDPANVPCRPFGRDHLVNVDADAPFVQIICDTSVSKALAWRAGCRAESSFRRHQLRYLFRLDQLHRWSEFDGGVRRLLETFVVEN